MRLRFHLSGERILGAAPGTEAHGKLQQLHVVGEQSLGEQSLAA